jgi:flagellar biosynthesis protein FliP
VLKKAHKKTIYFLALALLLGLGFFGVAMAAPGISLQFGDTASNTNQGVATSVQILILLTILSVAPSIILMTTSFVRFIIVFSMLRQAMGLGQLPPTQVLIGLSLILTFLVMKPTFSRMNDEALQPFIRQELSQEEFFKRGIKPLREFMLSQVKEEELSMVLKLANIDKPDSIDDLANHLLIAAYILGELKIAFQIGFTIFLPFVVIDMIAASALVSIGLMFLPPATISLPFKVILFVLIDGWNLLSESLVESFNPV